MDSIFNFSKSKVSGGYIQVKFRQFTHIITQPQKTKDPEYKFRKSLEFKGISEIKRMYLKSYNETFIYDVT